MINKILEENRHHLALFAELYNTYIDKEPLYKDYNIWLKENLILLEEEIKEEVISYIGCKQGWEETEDIYRKHFKLKTKYK